MVYSIISPQTLEFTNKVRTSILRMKGGQEDVSTHERITTDSTVCSSRCCWWATRRTSRAKGRCPLLRARLRQTSSAASLWRCLQRPMRTWRRYCCQGGMGGDQPAGVHVPGQVDQRVARGTSTKEEEVSLHHLVNTPKMT